MRGCDRDHAHSSSRDAAELQIGEAVVEKDYVIGWLLWAIGSHPQLLDNWVFKGGTCLKKCFFETYRFSEDSDFTLAPESAIDADSLIRAFGEISRTVYGASGIQIPADQVRFVVSPSGRYAEGRLYYSGPRRPSGNLPPIKLDLISDELLACDPIRRQIFHPYLDGLPGTAEILAYSFDEIFAEKLRAMAERGRPRDLYDVVHIFRNRGQETSPDFVRTVLERKCAHKGLAVPTFQAALSDERRIELAADWEHMLAHQLPVLPDLDQFINDLKVIFTWLEGRRLEPRPIAPVPGTARLDVTWHPPPGISGSVRTRCRRSDMRAQIACASIWVTKVACAEWSRTPLSGRRAVTSCSLHGRLTAWRREHTVLIGSRARR